MYDNEMNSYEYDSKMDFVEINVKQDMEYNKLNDKERKIYKKLINNVQLSDVIQYPS